MSLLGISPDELRTRAKNLADKYDTFRQEVERELGYCADLLRDSEAALRSRKVNRDLIDQLHEMHKAIDGTGADIRHNVHDIHAAAETLHHFVMNLEVTY